jgi:hypothetical protein
MKIDENFQFNVLAKAQTCWEICHSDHYFRDMPKEESQARVQLLNNQAQALQVVTEVDRLFNKLTRG